MKRALPEDFAEKNADFIFSYIQTVWSNPTSYKVDSAQEIREIPNNKNGLYIFFLETLQFKIKYPIYVGFTSTNFRKRFQGHQQKGVIKTVLIEKTFPQDMSRPFQLKVTCLPLKSPMVAKLIESVFLASFDFCLNDSENEEVRLKIDTNEKYPVATSKQRFDKVFKKAFDEIKLIYEAGENV